MEIDWRTALIVHTIVTTDDLRERISNLGNKNALRLIMELLTAPVDVLDGADIEKLNEVMRDS